MEKKSINHKSWNCHYTVEGFSKDELNKKGIHIMHYCWSNISAIVDKIESEKQFIIIEDFRTQQTEEYINLIVKTINKITTCELISKDNKEWIRFKLLNTYDQNLILLNFIRYLWFVQLDRGFDYKVFFETLKKSRYKDSLMRLTKANKEACKEFTSYHTHSNCAPYSRLKLKTTEELLKYKGLSTQTFLTT